MTARIFGKFRPRRTLTRKLTIELWVVGLASAILLALAIALNGAADSAADTVGASGPEGSLARGDEPRSSKAFMERAAFASASRPAPAAVRDSALPELAPSAPRSVPALSRAAAAPKANEQKPHATRVASAILPAPGASPVAPPASVQRTSPAEGAPWRLLTDTGAFAVANLAVVGNSLSSLAKKFSL